MLSPFFTLQGHFQNNSSSERVQYISRNLWFEMQAWQIHLIHLLKGKSNSDSFQKEKVIFLFLKGKCNFALF